MANSTFDVALGVKEVSTNVADKLVEVTCDINVEGSTLADALKTWAAAADQPREVIILS